MVHVTVGRWGNNLAVRLPGEIAETAKLREGDRAEIEVRDREVVIRPAEPPISLADLFRGKSPEEWLAEYAGAYDWGPDIGREAIPE
jgi:antitoxin MazE